MYSAGYIIILIRNTNTKYQFAFCIWRERAHVSARQVKRVSTKRLVCVVGPRAAFHAFDVKMGKKCENNYHRYIRYTHRTHGFIGCP